MKTTSMHQSFRQFASILVLFIPLNCIQTRTKIYHISMSKFHNFDINHWARFLLTGARDRSIRVWKIGHDNRSELMHTYNHSHYITCLAFNDEGTRLYSGDGVGTVKVWICESSSGDFQLRGISSISMEPDQVCFNLILFALLSNILTRSHHRWPV